MRERTRAEHVDMPDHDYTIDGFDDLRDELDDAGQG